VIVHLHLTEAEPEASRTSNCTRVALGRITEVTDTARGVSESDAPTCSCCTSIDVNILIRVEQRMTKVYQGRSVWRQDLGGIHTPLVEFCDQSLMIELLFLQKRLRCIQFLWLGRTSEGQEKGSLDLPDRILADFVAQSLCKEHRLARHKFVVE